MNLVYRRGLGYSVNRPQQSFSQAKAELNQLFCSLPIHENSSNLYFYLKRIRKILKNVFMKYPMNAFKLFGMIITARAESYSKDGWPDDCPHRIMFGSTQTSRRVHFFFDLAEAVWQRNVYFESMLYLKKSQIIVYVSHRPQFCHHCPLLQKQFQYFDVF